MVDLQKVGRATRIIIEAEQRGLRVEFLRDDHVVALPLLHGPFRLGHEFVSSAIVFEKLGACLQLFHLDFTFSIAPADVLSFAPRVLLMWEAICGTGERLFPVSWPSPHARLAAGKSAALVMGVAIPIDGQHLVVGLALTGTASFRDSTGDGPTMIAIACGAVRVLFRSTVPGNEWSREKLGSRLWEEAVKLKKEGFEVTSAPAPDSAAFASLVD